MTTTAEAPVLDDLDFTPACEYTECDHQAEWASITLCCGATALFCGLHAWMEREAVRAAAKLRGLAICRACGATTPITALRIEWRRL